MATCQFLATEANQQDDPLPGIDSQDQPGPSSLSGQNTQLSKQSSKQQQKSQAKKHKKTRAKKSKPPIELKVKQLVEMGFPRHLVEHALKELHEEEDPRTELVVAWLLDHPELEVPEREPEIIESASDETSEDDDDDNDDCDSDFSSSSDTDSSTSDSESTSPLTDFKIRSDFASNDEYARYVRDHIQVGMMARCCRTYEEVHEGDIGRVIKVNFVLSIFPVDAILTSSLVLTPT